MLITLLGTGDATGTPQIGCTCPQCRLARSAGFQRLRTSLLIEKNDRYTLIETTPDLRQQLLSCSSPHIDNVIWTHGHFDHFMGFGEFYRVQEMPRVYGGPGVIAYCGEIFKFLRFESFSQHAFRPFHAGELEITLIPVNHPPAETYGVILRDGETRIGFTSDTNACIPEESLSFFEDLDLLFIDALVPPGYNIPKHMNYQDALLLAKRLRASDYRCVHMSHHIPFKTPHTGSDGECFLFPD
jgi:phosphoribosyl 1,2-cyclic phosphate phosphodiesterase